MSDSHDPIVEIALTPVFVPFKAHIREMLQGGQGKVAMALDVEDPWLGGDFLMCRITTESGVSGWGEVFVWMVETGVSPPMMADLIEQQMARFVLRRDAFSISAVRQKLDSNIARNEVTKGLIDVALHDLAARKAGISVAALLGGAQLTQIPLAVVLPLAPVPVVTSLVRQAMGKGINTYRLKLGAGIGNDVALVSAVRDLIGPDRRIRVDYNQAYQPNEAVAAIKAIAPYGIDYVEQPVGAADYAGMAYVQSRVDVPVMAHEGAFGLQDIHTLHAMGGIRVIGINGERPGGMTEALRAIDFARAHGLGVALHNQPTGFGSAMLIHLHAARASAIAHATELQGHLMLEDDLIVDEIDYEDGLAKLPTGPGWGVEADLAAIERYATGKTRIIRA